MAFITPATTPFGVFVPTPRRQCNTSTFHPPFLSTTKIERVKLATTPSPTNRTPQRAVTMSANIVNLSAGVGTSTASSTAIAVADAVKSAYATLAGQATAAIVLTTVDRAIDDVQAALREHLPDVPVHAATSCAGTLTNDGPAPGAISIFLLHAPGHIAVASQAASEQVTPAEAARRATKQLSSQLDGEIGQLLLFSAPGSEEAVLKALSEELPGVPVFGGSAADNSVAGFWRVFSADDVFGDGVSIMALKKGVKFGAALVPPYEPTERSAVITSAEGRCIHQLDGRPAAEVLLEWMGELIGPQARDGGNIIVESAAFPLGIERVPGNYIGIHAAQVLENGSVGLFAEVSTGERLTVMKRFNEADAPTAASVGLERAYEKAVENGGLSHPKAGLMIYCGGLSIAVGDDLAQSLEGMKKKAPVLGMTAFGEQGSFDGCNVHSNLAVGIALFE